MKSWPLCHRYSVTGSPVIVFLALALACNNAMAAGALAIDEAKGDQHGWAINFPTYREAEQEALRECGEGCSIVMRVSDSCAAYAADQQENSTVVGWSWGFPNPDEARNRARAECTNRGGVGNECIVRVWGCDVETSEPRSTPGTGATPGTGTTSGLPAGVTGEEMCTVKRDGSACWTELDNQPGCYIWQHSLLESSATTWSGACTDGLAEGTGTITGGFGERSYTATGQLQRGIPYGQWVKRDADGSVSEGPFVDGKRHGRWVKRNPDGYVQEGPFVNDKQHGHWVIRLSGSFVNEGPYVDGKPHGHWVTRYSDGSVYEGPFVDGKQHGQWVTRLSDGDVMEDTFVNGELQE